MKLAIDGGTPVRSKPFPPSPRAAPAGARLPVAERAGYEEGVWLTQNVLLAEREDLDDVVEAIAKVQGAR